MIIVGLPGKVLGQWYRAQLVLNTCIPMWLFTLGPKLANASSELFSRVLCRKQWCNEGNGARGRTQTSIWMKTISDTVSVTGWTLKWDPAPRWCTHLPRYRSQYIASIASVTYSPRRHNSPLIPFLTSALYTVCPKKSEPLNILQQQPQICSDLNKFYTHKTTSVTNITTQFHVNPPWLCWNMNF